MPTAEPAKWVVLDTHVWYWLVKGDETIRDSPCLTAIDRAAESGLVGVSAISVWEICMLDAKGRIRFHMDRLEWIRQALSAPGMSLVPLSPEIAVESTRLPGAELLVADPADRIIIATARILGGMLVTRDKRLLDYGRRGYLKALPV